MSADFVDALIGYQYYLELRGETSLQDINSFLVKNRRAEISLRTFQHYKKLIAYGFRSYIPINKFDVFRSLGKLQMAADRRRYTRHKSDIQAKISRNRTDWVDCTIIDISIVGFGILTASRFHVPAGAQVWIQMEGYNHIPAIVAWRQHEVDTSRLGAKAFEFIENFRLEPTEKVSSRLRGLLILSRNEDGNIDWKYLVYVLEICTELIEATSDLIHVLSKATVQSSSVIPRPLLQSIQFSSPGNAEIKVDFGVADIIKIVIEALQSLGLYRKRYKEETRSIAIDNDRKELEMTGIELMHERQALENQILELEVERKAIENANFKIESIKNAINIENDSQARLVSNEIINSLLGEPIKQILRIDELPTDLFKETSPEHGILEKRVIPAVLKLLNGDDPAYELKIETAEEVEQTTSNEL